MPKPEDMTIEKLEQWVEARESWLKRVIDFVECITMAKGKITRNDESSGHTYTLWELHDFGGFDFHYSTGHSIMGGNMVSVYLRKKAVLNLWYQLAGEIPEVLFWEDDIGWQLALTSIMDRKEEIINMIDEASGTQKELVVKKEEDDRRRKELLEKARRLGIE